MYGLFSARAIISAFFAVNGWFIHRIGIANGLLLPEGGFFEAQNGLPPPNLL
jgi:hypothetical protein